MEFTHPERLYALYFLPILVFLLVYGARKRRDELVAFTGGRFADALAPGRSWRKALLKGTLKVLGFAFLVLAFAGPRFGTHLVKMEREGVDLVLALDTSLSMLAEDMQPNRLERAKQEMIDLIKGLQGDRVGIVVFAGDAFALCPLTVDYDAALMFVRSVGIDAVPEPGTAIGKAIEKSVALFETSKGRDRAIILVTDGESHEGEPIKEARVAGEKRIKIYAIGIGNPAGDLIPMRGTGGGIEGYKKDRRGETVLTRLDEATLQEIAAASDGKYLPATREGLELRVLYDEISGMEKKKIKGEFVERRKDRFPIFLGFSLFFLLIDVIVATRGGSRSIEKAKPLHTGATGLWLLAVFVFALSSVLVLPWAASAKKINRGKVSAGNDYYKAGQYDKALFLYREALGDSADLPKNPQGVLYNQGNALYMMEKYPEALEHYQLSFSEDTTLTGRMLHNRGNTLVKQGRLEDAVKSYLGALRFFPDDRDVRHNLELALRMLQQQQQQQQQGDRSEDQQDQQEDREKEQKQAEQQKSESDQGEGDEQQSMPQPPDSTQMSPAHSDTSRVQPRDSNQMKELSKEDALRILRALEEQEKKLQQQKQKAAFKRTRKKGKDW